MSKRLILGCAALICITSASMAGPSQSPAAHPQAVLKDAAARALEPLQALCLSGTGQLPGDKPMSEDILRIYGLAQARGVVLTAPAFADAMGPEEAPTWRVCTAVASVPATPLKDLEPFAFVQIAATPGWRGQCLGFQDKIQVCLDELLQRISSSGQIATGTPRVVFGEPQPDPAATVTAISIPTRSRPPPPKPATASGTPLKADERANDAPARAEVLK